MFRFLFLRLAPFCLIWGLAGGIALYGYLYFNYGRDLPSIAFMKDYAPPTVTRLHAADGQVIAEFANERRFFVPIETVPRHVKGAFLSAEDRDFYQHGGIDFLSLGGAVLNNIQRYRAGRSLVGASTITQQVAKNFVTGGARSAERKAREAFIAWKLEREFEKDEILELYLNEIFFGQRSYGLGAAALTYFKKSVDELTVAEAAYLAAVIKGPSNYHPVDRKAFALDRRDWVIGQMARNGFVSEGQADEARAADLKADFSYKTEILASPYFADEIKRKLDAEYGKLMVEEEGLSIRTTLSPRYQDIARRAVRKGLIDYDRRHGWRGPLGRITPSDPDWFEQLARFQKTTPGLGDWTVALVYEVRRDGADIAFADDRRGTVPLDELTWARPWREDQTLGSSVKSAGDVLAVGDVVAVTIAQAGSNTWALQQVPDVQGALVAMNPHTGRVHTLVGGFDWELSQFNRATQAQRQPGSTFKPFVYLAALDEGMSPFDTVLDSPVVVELPDGEIYKPRNSDGKFMGVQPLYVGLEKSRNLMTLRLAQKIGMDAVSDQAGKFGIDDNLPPYLSMALGSGGTSLLKMTTAYAMLVNGGKKLDPLLYDRIQDRTGKVLVRTGAYACPNCQDASFQAGARLPVFLDKRAQVADPVNSYQVVSMLRGVVARGTARRIGQTIDRPVGGKTGTTNNSQDAWFIGFTPDLVVGVWVGFDTPKTLGKGEYGGRAAAPIFRDFLNEALAGEPAQAFRVPPGVTYKHIDPITGVIKLDESSADSVEVAAVTATPVETRRITPQGEVQQFGQTFGNQTFGDQSGFAQPSAIPASPQLLGYDQYGQPVWSQPTLVQPLQQPGFVNNFGSGALPVQPVEEAPAAPVNLDGVY